MSSTSKTTHYNLPQFAATDKPAWLTDINPAMSAIDAGIWGAKESADSAMTAADTAEQAATAASAAATTAQSTAETAKTTADEAKALAEGGGKGTLTQYAIAALNNPNYSPWTNIGGGYFLVNNLLATIPVWGFYTSTNGIPVDETVTLPNDTNILTPDIKGAIPLVVMLPQRDVFNLGEYNPADSNTWYLMYGGKQQYLIIYKDGYTRIYMIYPKAAAPFKADINNRVYFENGIIIRR